MLVGVGCKNYDDDIKQINNRIDELTTGKIASIESQLQSMQKVVDELKKADEALGKRIDELKKNADANAKAISDLTDVQTQIKKDIDKIKGEYVSSSSLNTTLSSYATLDHLSKTYAKLSDLGVFTTEKAIKDAIEKARQEAVAAAGAAMEAAFQGKFDAAVAAAGLVDATKLAEELEAFDAKIMQSIKDAMAEGGWINEAIAAQIADANEILTAELKKWVSGRMTSLLLIPETYVDGIEVIDVKTLTYIVQAVTSSETEEKYENLAGATNWYLSEIATPVRYHVSPSVVTNADVKAPSFLFEQVKTRAAFAKSLLKIEANDFSTEVGKAWNIKNSEMSVQARRIASAKTLAAELGGSYNAFTTALQVPIADNLLQEGETGTVVYSDYAMIAEQIGNIKIAALKDAALTPATTDYSCTDGDHKHFYSAYISIIPSATTDAAHKDSKANAPCDFNKPLDLLTLVTGCTTLGSDVRQINKEDLAKAGLAFRFAVPTKPFMIGTSSGDEGDQQKYITLTGSTVTSKTPSGTQNNRASVGKTPVVRAELIDTKRNNVVVDVCYIKVEWTEPSFEFNYAFPVYTLGCELERTMNWLAVTKEILEPMNMSKAEFLQNYEIESTLTTVDTYADRALGTATASAGTEIYYNFADAQPETVPVFTWTLTSAQMGTLINLDGTTKEEFKTGKDMHVTLHLKRKDGSATGKVKINLSVNIVPPVLPCTVNYIQSLWSSDYSYIQIEPLKIQQLNPNWKTEATISNTVDYKQPMSQYFTGGMLLSGMNDCAKWDMQFAKKQPVVGMLPNSASIKSLLRMLVR